MKSFWKFLDRLATAGLVVAGLGLLWTPTSSGDDIGLFGFGEWTVVTVNGPVQTKAGDNTWNNWAVAKRGTRVSVYGSVKTGRGASATLARGKDRMVVSPNSRITIAPVGPSPASLNETPVTILQSTGRALYNVQTRPSRRFQVLTPFLVAGVKGTTFSVDVSTAGASVSVSEGTVSVSPSAGGEGVDVSIGMTAVAIVLFGSALLILRSQMHKSEMVGRDVLSANAEAAVFLVERLKTGRLIRLSGMEVAETAEMQRLTERQRASLVHLYRLMALVTVVLEPIVIGASFVLIYLSVTLFGTGIEQIGIFLALILRLLPVVKELANTRQATRSTGPAFEVVVKRLESMAREREPENGGLEFAGLARSITFEQVSFAYEGNDASPALRAFSAVLEKGKLYALVGPSGAGKSTLTDMIPRLRWPDSGRILIDDTPLEDFDLASLRASIAYAPQTPQLFNVSIAEHIRYGKPNATMEDIHRAAEMAGVAGFVADLANGYETEIGEAGLRLSGGQRQRLDLARALVRQAPILILDEPTSNLDAESEVRLRDAMQRIRTKTETTMIVIAHRLATVAMADKILVLDRGLLVTEGPHDELMSADGWYASAFSAQQAVSGRETDERETANA